MVSSYTRFLQRISHLTCLFIFLSSLQVSANDNNVGSTKNTTVMGSMKIHHMAIDSTLFSPEIARAYNIERSRYNALVNIAVLDNSLPNTPAQTVSIMGSAKNNIGQLKALEFDEIKEGSAIYYLAQVNFSNEETLHFNLMITNGNETHTLKFSQKFYVD